MGNTIFRLGAMCAIIFGGIRLIATQMYTIGTILERVFCKESSLNEK